MFLVDLMILGTKLPIGQKKKFLKRENVRPVRSLRRVNNIKQEKNENSKKVDSNSLSDVYKSSNEKPQNALTQMVF